MTAAYIEHRPRSTDPKAETKHFAIVVDGKDVRECKTQREAEEWADGKGYRPIHVARVRHLQERDKPDHWRKYK